MLKYGHFFDSEFDPKKERVYSLFVNYFDNINFTKLSEKDGFSLYYARIACLLSTEVRYLIAIVKNDRNSVGTVFPLLELKWISLQTRSLEENHRIPQQSYDPKRGSPYNTVLNIKSREELCTVYSSVEYPIEITLYNTIKKKKNPYEEMTNKYEYPNNGTLVTALETYKTIVTFIS